ncbi:alpha/beta fold hydrolase [bacterium]|nr:alpha/beta fold hydrolase [bacterium]
MRKPRVGQIFSLRTLSKYQTRPPMILVNGLAEQADSWCTNRPAWSKQFDVKVPELLVYDGDALHRHIETGGEVTVGYLADRLHTFLEEFVQKPPYHLVGSSLGCQVILTYAIRNPEKVGKIVLMAPSGFYGDENLPVIEGVSRSNYGTLVGSVFYRKYLANEDLIRAFERKFKDRKWKKGVLKTLRGTVGHSVSDLLEKVPHPVLVIWGADDKVLSDVPGSIRAADRMIRARQVVIPKCGHAPQIEKSRLVNSLVSKYLRDKLTNVPQQLDAARWLRQNPVSSTTVKA